MLLVYSQENVVDKLKSIVLQDSEAFPRRACLKLIQDLHTKGNFPASETTAIFVQCMHDLDWEVKQIVLAHWDKLIKEILSKYATRSEEVNKQDVVTSLFDNTSLQCIFVLVLDHDLMIQQEAAMILVNLLTFLELTLAELCGMVRNIIRQNQTPVSLQTIPQLNMRAVVEINLQERIELGKLSADLHVRRPETLLEDILVDLDNKIVQTDEEDEIVIDCY